MGCTTSKSGNRQGGNHYGAGSDKIAFMNFINENKRNPKEDYKFGKILGEGTYVHQLLFYLFSYFNEKGTVYKV